MVEVEYNLGKLVKLQSRVDGDLEEGLQLAEEGVPEVFGGGGEGLQVLLELVQLRG